MAGPRIGQWWIVMTGLCALGQGAQAGPDIRTGLWETTVTTEMQGMPVGGIPPIIRQSCITPQDLVPDTRKTGEDCEMSETQVAGNEVSWRVSCDSEGMQTQGVGRITYQGDSYQGTIEMTMTGSPMGELRMTQRLSGRRIGDCD